jgi:ATP-dependent DNA ligase
MKPIFLMKATENKDEWFMGKVWNDWNWIAEKKFDGGRYQVLVEGNDIKIFSRRVWVERTGNVPHVIEDIKKLNLPSGTILDGEMIHPTDFNSVISIMNSLPANALAVQEKIGLVEFKVFDIPIYKGEEVKLKLVDRKKLLEKLFDNKHLNYVELIKGTVENKKEYFDYIIDDGGEGVILKNLNSEYMIGEDESYRSSAWIKVKKLSTYDCVVIGGEEGKGKYLGSLGALRIAQYRNGKLTDIGSVSGMNDKQRDAWWKKINENKFNATIINGKKYVQLNPKAYWIIEIEAQEKAKNAYRFPRFLHERSDKKLEECVW